MKKKKKENEDLLNQDTVSLETLREAELNEDQEEDYNDLPYYQELNFNSD